MDAFHEFFTFVSSKLVLQTSLEFFFLLFQVKQQLG